ncbi:MAG TPA: hydrogenase maturation protease [Thermodesulfobacteriota bacterium]|nr:hydrogenase maturation protease [Thermodesulfobacteriota bacterium]
MSKKTLVIGLGNPILSDDGAGIYVAREIKKRRKGLSNIAIIETSQGGIGLIDLMAGYERVIIVDSIKTANDTPGKFYRLRVGDLGDITYPCGPHFLDVRTAVELGSKFGYSMPGTIDIYAIEITDNTTFSENLTPEVEKGIPLLAEQIIEDLKEKNELLTPSSL